MSDYATSKYQDAVTEELYERSLDGSYPSTMNCPRCNEPAILGAKDYCTSGRYRLPCIVTLETAEKEPKEGWDYPAN